MDFISYYLCSMLDILNEVEICTFLSHNFQKKADNLKRL